MINLLEVFGVEEGEVFESQCSEYKIENNVIFIKLCGKWEKSRISVNDVAGVEVKRLPFVPKVNERYWSIVHDSCSTRAVVSTFFNDSMDMFRIETGFCYRTKEQAEREGIPKMKALIEKWGGKVE